ncbi:MAG: aldehyde ferredoxin oxidoreductase [Promethearchaeota archaeon]|nr:MAG: aldehyde ferredoxin oxidoreductase [Candidatus Lokiarchaeota archaeon]
MSEKLSGYNGKIAYVDLKNREIEIKDLLPQIAKEYIGGTGLSAKIIYDLLKPEDYEVLKNNPLSEINPIIFATGPLTGTIRPSSGRYSISAISPLTGIWGEGTSGGYFCISLKQSGYDAIVFRGKSDDPVYVYLNDREFEFKDAIDIWGNDTYSTQKIIKEKLNREKIRIACIGQGGENLVKYAAIINDEGRAQGRCGLGAVMGSKNLKALAIDGSNKVPIYNFNLMKDIRKQREEEAKKDFIKSASPLLFQLYGTNGYLDLGMPLGDVPALYFTKTEFKANKLTGKTLREEYPVLNYGCAGCTIRCGKQTILEHNGDNIIVDGPEYESVAVFGPMLGILDSKPVILAHHICNKFGIDTISCGVAISFLYYLIDNDLANSKISSLNDEIDLERLEWGKSDQLLNLIEKIGHREGLGDLLAEGVRRMAKELDIDPELAAQVKGLEFPMHDPRAFVGQALNYMTSCIGASHEKADWYNVEISTIEYPKLKIKKGFSNSKEDLKRREKGVAALQDVRAIDDSTVVCNFHNPELQDKIAYINAATNFGYNRKTLMQVGERINNIKRLISCKLGITRNDDRLPNHITKKLSAGRSAGVKLNLEKNLKNYYKARDWDWETGRPSENKLNELGINH